MNQLVVHAEVLQAASLRYTPAGIPALDLMLLHESEQVEMGQTRKVRLEFKAQCFGTDAETLSRQALGSAFEFTGFLSNTRNGKGVVFHIQAFTKI